MCVSLPLSLYICVWFMYAYTCVCMVYTCENVFVCSVGLCAHVRVSMCLCMRVRCMHVLIRMRLCGCWHVWVRVVLACVCTYVCVVYACVHVHVCAHVCMHVGVHVVHAYVRI